MATNVIQVSRGMSWTTAAVTAVLLFIASPAHAQYTSGSSGIHGPFPPVAIPAGTSTVLLNVTTGKVSLCYSYDTTNRPETCSIMTGEANLPGIPQGGLTTGVFEFTTFVLPDRPCCQGVTLEFVGNGRNLPIVILSQQDISIDDGWVLRADGRGGGYVSTQWIPGQGGAGGPGGFRGGDGGNGGVTPQNGSPGLGPAGGAGGVTSNSDPNVLVGGGAGAGPSTTSLRPLAVGSGGGGGAGISSGILNCGTNAFGFAGGGGGGGGGGLLLGAENTIALNGALNFSGGNGGYGYAGGSCGYLSGGGGAAGSVKLVARTVLGTGTLYLQGGYPAIGGPVAFGGQVVIEAFTNAFTGAIYGFARSAFVSAPTSPLQAGLPTLAITAVGGVPVGPNPTNNLTNPDIVFPTAPSNPVTVDLAATGIPLGTTVSVRAAPVAGGASATTATSTPLAGTVQSSTASASLDLAPGFGSITAWTTFMLTPQTLQSLGLSSLPTLDGERPDRIEVVAGGEEGQAGVFLVTPSGKRISIGAAKS